MIISLIFLLIALAMAIYANYICDEAAAGQLNEKLAQIHLHHIYLAKNMQDKIAAACQRNAANEEIKYK